MQQVQSRDMSLALSFGNIAASVSAEGVSWSPDVASDMSARLVGMVRELLQEAAQYGLLQTDSEFVLSEDIVEGDEDAE